MTERRGGSPCEPGNTRLKSFIDESKGRLRKILERLGWNEENTFGEAAELVHANQNDVRLDTDSEPELPPSCADGNSIKTDVAELRQIVNDESVEVPSRFSDLQLNFKREQKLAIYEHVVDNTKNFAVPAITVPALNEGTLTFADIVAEKKRETKRQRRYRRSKPTHIEEVRAVVDLQMQALQQYLKTKSAEDINIKPNMCNGRKRQSADKPKRLSRKTTREPKKHYKYHKSRSISANCENPKKSRHRSESPARSHKHKKQNERLRDRSASKKRKKHKHRSRSRDKNCKMKSSKQRSRSRNIKKKSHKRRSRSPSRDRHRNAVHYRRKDGPGSHESRL